MEKRPDLNTINLRGVRARTAEYPEIIAPLVRAAERGEPLEPIMLQIAKSFGFDTFLYAMSTAARPTVDSRLYVLTNMPIEWVVLWDTKGYLEVDPRVQHILESTLPLIWDQASTRGKTPRLDEFLDDAAKYGARSGVAFKVDDAHHSTVMMAFNSHLPIFDEVRRVALRQMLPFIRDFAMHFHELFIRTFLATTTSRLQGVKPSARELTCLQLAAQGLSRQEISERMQVGARTVQLYFDSIRAKLNANTREEAVAIALSRGLIGFKE
jgi:DNA-binding CsgD family transcriptional regulator